MIGICPEKAGAIMQPGTQAAQIEVQECDSARGCRFDARGGAQPGNSIAQPRNLVGRELAFGFDGGEQQLLDRTRDLPGFNKAQVRADAA